MVVHPICKRPSLNESLNATEVVTSSLELLPSVEVEVVAGALQRPSSTHLICPPTELSDISSAVLNHSDTRTPGAYTIQAERKLSLLLVDDNPINLKLLAAYASKNMHPHLTAIHGQEAVSVYKASVLRPSCAVKPEVVFLDINMPIMNGFRAARCIRAFEKEVGTSPTMLIALTCLGSDEAKEEAQASGIDMFLTKPIRLRDLTKVLKGVAKVLGTSPAK